MRPSLLALVLVLAAAPVRAGGGKVVVESARTGGHAARDGALTFGRTTRDFFTQGTGSAKRTWDANASRLKANARANAARVRQAARE
jgi:hypothetical protein